MEGWVILLVHDHETVDELILIEDGGFYAAPLGHGEVFSAMDAEEHLRTLRSMPGHGTRFTARAVSIPARLTATGLERKH